MPEYKSNLCSLFVRFNSWPTFHLPRKDTITTMKTLIVPRMDFLILIFSLVITSLASTPLNPESMLSAPRRGSALPNSAGTLALYTHTAYSFDTHKTTRGLYVLNITDGSSWLFSNKSGISNPVWLSDGDKFVWLAAQDDGSTNFLVGDAKKPERLVFEKYAIITVEV